MIEKINIVLDLIEKLYNLGKRLKNKWWKSKVSKRDFEEYQKVELEIFKYLIDMINISYENDVIQNELNKKIVERLNIDIETQKLINI